MEYAKKMVLVDPRVLESTPPVRNFTPPAVDTTHFTQPESTVIDMTIKGLHEGLTKILNNPNLSEEDRSKLYSHYLSDYLTMKNKQTQVYRAAAQPLTPAAPTPAGAPAGTPEPQGGSPLEKEVLDSAPQVLKKQAQLLMDRVKQDPSMSWNSKGELIVEGKAIPNSNIVDLVNDMLRKRKGVNPTGWQSFARQLHRSNVPQDLIRNQYRWQFMHQGADIDSDDVSPSTIESTIHSLETGAKKKKKKKSQPRARSASAYRPSPGGRPSRSRAPPKHLVGEWEVY